MLLKYFRLKLEINGWVKPYVHFKFCSVLPHSLSKVRPIYATNKSKRVLICSRSHQPFIL